MQVKSVNKLWPRPTWKVPKQLRLATGVHGCILTKIAIVA